MSEPVAFYNRYSGNVETETIYGEGFLRWAYDKPLGRAAVWLLVKRSLFSRWYGLRMSQWGSRSRVQPFIERYGIPVEEMAGEPGCFPSFNAFFARRLKPHARPIVTGDDAVAFPADGRHFAIPDVGQNDGIFVKGVRFDLTALLGDATMAEQYARGSLLISRLCPVDYHRFHFPAAGIPSETVVLNGPLFSVSPIALRKNLGYLWENKRTVTRLETPNLGTVLCMEIGATCVGTIGQTFDPGSPVDKGAEKGYFAFGGSSTITIFEPGAVLLENDLRHHSAKQVELYAKIGTRMGYAS